MKTPVTSPEQDHLPSGAGFWFRSIPLDEVVEQVLDSLLQVGLLQGDWVAFVGDLYDQFPQFVQLAFDLEEALGRQREPEEEKADLGCR